MRERVMAMLRSILGLEHPAVVRDEMQRAALRLQEQAARIKAIDERIKADNPNHYRRRATDR